MLNLLIYAADNWSDSKATLAAIRESVIVMHKNKYKIEKSIDYKFDEINIYAENTHSSNNVVKIGRALCIKNYKKIFLGNNHEDRYKMMNIVLKKDIDFIISFSNDKEDPMTKFLRKRSINKNIEYMEVPNGFRYYKSMDLFEGEN